MRLPVRFALFLAAAIFLVGCAAGGVDVPPASRANVPTSIATSTPSAAIVSAATSSNPIDSPPEEIGGLRASRRSLPSVNAPGGSVPSASVRPQALDPVAPSPYDYVPSSASGASNASVPVAKPSRPLGGGDLYIYLPPQAKPRQTLRALVVLHGMGGRGDDFAQSLLKEAERNNWVLLAPTFQYRNYLDPKELMEDDIEFSQRILDTLDVLPQRLNLKLRQHVLLYGFSRGAQLAHRFAYFYPERVASVVALSAGAYTMPTEKGTGAKGAQVIPFPYGVGDLRECVGHSVNWQALKKVSFWIGVGAEDDQAGDVARAFDQYGGKNRIERARAFQQALQALGINVHLAIFPDAAHELTPEMRAGAMKFPDSNRFCGF